MKVEYVPVEYANPLVNMYLSDFSKVGHLFDYDPGNNDSFRERQKAIMNDYHTDRRALVRILSEYNKGLHCGEKTLDNLKRLQDPETTVVITGQQAGILTGPLYTIYKTLSVIQLAHRAALETGRDVAPVFWVAAEDHDYAEIDHIDMVDREQNLVRLKLGYNPPGKMSVGDIPVTEEVFRLIEELEALTNPSEWKKDILGKVAGMAREADSLASWFARVMSWLFREQGLVLIDPMNRELRRLWSGTFQAFLDQSGEANERLRAGVERVRALGAEPQVEKDEDNVNMFLYVGGERMPLLKAGDSYRVRGRDDTWSIEELKTLAAERPEQLSPNVVLRPVAQDVLLPIMAYVAGPGEISYYALYRDIYHLFGQRMPVIFPRANVTLVEGSVAKNMYRYGVEFSLGKEGLRERLNENLDAQDRLGIETLFDDYTKEIRNTFNKLVDKAAGVDPELTGHGSESLNRILHQVEHFRKKVNQYHRKANDTMIKRFRRMEDQLFPRDNWQERVFNIFPYLFKYGPDIVDRLAELPLLENNDHKLIFL
ncbi:MAG: bacillithiol biosynthesis cysteine-adding enzyme BshC [Firmicutes bacterium HGW-Firmicutes-14]|nr:MAG: bacillithiol biosynthesis cysteine-adding enzyme BshC [Firmicutes bacterium HGW-Firmicutes-14]